MACFQSSFLVLCLFTIAGRNGGHAHECIAHRGSCATDEKEIFRDSHSHRSDIYHCCKSDADPERVSRYEKGATACIPTECIKTSESGGNLCTVSKRRVAKTGKTYSFVEAIRDDCVTRSGAPGVEALCCGEGTMELMLTTLLGAEPHEFPHFARLEVRNGKMVDICGGTIYNERYIVTASHCTVSKKEKKSLPTGKMHVILDVLISGKSTSQKFGVEEIHIHPNASLTQKTNSHLHNDIAILKLDRDITFSDKIQALPLAPKGFHPREFSDTAIIMGFGDTDTLTTSKKLQKADSYIRSNNFTLHDQKVRYFHRWQPFSDQLLFLGGYQEGIPSPSASGGDSGGPAVCRDREGYAVLCGLTSFGTNNKDRCEKYKNEAECGPTAYVKVDHFREWIEKVAGDQSKARVLKQPLYGKDVSYEDYPSQVEIFSGGKGGNKQETSCGGTLLSEQIVITSAHCVANEDGTMKNGLMVTHKVTGKARRERVKEIRVMDGFRKASNERPKRIAVFAAKATWDAPYYENDLALVKLSKPLNVRNFPKIAKTKAEPGKSMEVAWVVGDEYHHHRRGSLVEREFELMTNTECQRRMDRLQHAGSSISIDENIVCGVERYSGGSKCDRTLGGGLFCGKQTLCGIQTFRLCEFSLPSAFLDVGLSSEWIEKTMKDMEN